ncbi:MAG TPA: cobalamin-binding protein, partial [Acidimicrobiales bacterium]|nr:cobalamin-binding protein [Acidimicrobiales bacterium]
ATEIVYALGLEDDLVGVTHECDWPPAARTKRPVSFSALPPAVEPAEVDRLVSASITGGEPIYRLDNEAIRELRPDLVLTQDLCAVCAVPSGHVNEALEVLGCRAEVLSMDPSSLDEVLDCILQVGTATAAERPATELVDGLRSRLRAVGDRVSGRKRPRTFALEWSDPPFNGGHWVPEMIELAGGEPVLGSPGTPSIRVSWDQIVSASPEVVVFMPCGYDLDAAWAEAVTVLARAELQSVRSFFAVDASSYFSRPGPRLVDGVEILASALHPTSAPDCPPGALRQLR